MARSGRVRSGCRQASDTAYQEKSDADPALSSLGVEHAERAKDPSQRRRRSHILTSAVAAAATLHLDL